jgi:hypothetical protein
LSSSMRVKALALERAQAGQTTSRFDTFGAAVAAPFSAKGMTWTTQKSLRRPSKDCRLRI